MGEAEGNGRGNELAFEAYGLRIVVAASRPDLLHRVVEILPPGSRLVSPVGVQSRFEVTSDERGNFVLHRNGEELSGTSSTDVDLVLEMLDSQIRLYLGTRAPETIFIHAGVVAHNGKAIVIPATSFAGKTTLVAALVKRGAEYYSDEFAVIARDGRVLPYAKPLSLRLREGWTDQTDHPVETIGGKAGEGPIPVGLIVATIYKPGAKWNPKRLSSGAGALQLLANAVPAQERPREVMDAITKASSDAIVLEGDRGEADEVAPLLLAELDRQQG